MAEFFDGLGGELDVDGLGRNRVNEVGRDEMFGVEQSVLEGDAGEDVLGFIGHDRRDLADLFAVRGNNSGALFEGRPGDGLCGIGHGARY